MKADINEMLESEMNRLREAVVLSQAVSDNVEREARRYPRQLDGGQDETFNRALRFYQRRIRRNF